MEQYHLHRNGMDKSLCLSFSLFPRLDRYLYICIYFNESLIVLGHFCVSVLVILFFFVTIMKTLLKVQKETNYLQCQLREYPQERNMQVTLLHPMIKCCLLRKMFSHPQELNGSASLVIPVEGREIDKKRQVRKWRRISQRTKKVESPSCIEIGVKRRTK